MEQRRCVHLCFCDDRDHSCTLHHIDVAPFFSGDMDTEAMEDAPLPAPAARFDRPPPPLHNDIDFHLLGAGTKVVSTDGLRRTLIYDVSRGAVRAGPMLHATKYHPISVAVGDDSLYILKHIPRDEQCFEALLYDPDVLSEDWSWHDLPQPPFVHAPGYNPSRVLSHTVVGDGTDASIWISTEGVGTYSFHTGRRAWRKEGDWELPFDGNAEYVPGCNVWFGLSSENGLLCAADLATATSPEVCGVWEDFRPPVEWFPCTSHLVHLGFGKLCVVRFFATDPTDSWRSRDPVAILTAIEVGPRDDGGGIQMVKHTSRCIKLSNHNKSLNWVL